MEEDVESWNDFAMVAAVSACWCCGRYAFQKPPRWYGPFLIERSHIVNKPRRKDRRVAGLLCSRCHRIEHGERLDGSMMIQVPTLAQMLWLKRERDPEYFDFEYLQANSVGRLPELEEWK